MAYSEGLAERIRDKFISVKNIVEKKMMGGLTFMVNGKMCVGVLGDDLMVRIGPEKMEASLKKKGAKVLRFTGRASKGFLLIEPNGTDNESDLNYWLGLALEYNPKAKASKKK